nr:acetamidase/formamidase family protein [Sulfoacidibacillus thermotolerans]
MKQAAKDTVFVDRFTDGILDPSRPMLGPVRSGGYIVANTAPGCWGPMITPALRGGHEVTQPVFVDGAEVGDAIVIRIKSIQVTSIATSSGNDQTVEGSFLGDPYCAGKCPNCGTMYPETRLEGIGEGSVRCVHCGADASPFKFTNGYTIAFDPHRKLGVTLPKGAAEQIAKEGRSFMCTPEHSIQNPIVTFAPHDIVGAVARMRPFLGQLGTTPAAPLPDSHNAGDFGSFLIGAPHQYAMTKEQLQEAKTDGHMDINKVREGAIVICPVKVPGGGVYLGDMHALQGDGEIAGHTCDVAGLVTLQVHVLKGIHLDGPILLPNEEDLPYLAKPLSSLEREVALAEAKKWGFDTIEDTLPIAVIGTGENLNIATENGLERAANLLKMTVPEVKNRATITGAIQIGRHPGVVTVTFLAPLSNLKEAGILEITTEQYKH